MMIYKLGLAVEKPNQLSGATSLLLLLQSAATDVLNP